MKLLIDENISFAEEAFSQFGEVELLPGRSINKNKVQNADVLIVRSITNVNEELLEGTHVKFVGTATIGTDHVDIEYLNKSGIKFSSAVGCNSDAVAEYALTALSKIVFEKNLSFRELSIGIVGTGNIGGRVSKYCSALGMKVLKNDPPLKRKTGGKDFLPLDDLMDADIITMHVPLNMGGEDKTFHLFDKKRMEKIKHGAIIINTSRGPVIDNTDLQDLSDKKNFTLVLDVWENEPSVNLKLLEKTFIASPHIAGYSLEGKVNGTKMIYDELCDYLNTEKTWSPLLPEVDNPEIKINNHKSFEDAFYFATSSIYKIEKEKMRMMEMKDMKTEEIGGYFDSLRKNYDFRREFNNFILEVDGKEISRVMKKLRFNI